jgi:hypothetical protein
MGSHSETTPASTFISASDYVIFNCPTNGTFRPFDYLIKFDFRQYEFSLSEYHWQEIKMNSFGSVISYMEREQGYIESTGGEAFKLTQIGKEVKRKGGHDKYIKFIEDRDNAIIKSATYAKNTAIYTKWIAIATIATVITLIAIRIVDGCNHSTNLNNTSSNIPANHAPLDTSK